MIVLSFKFLVLSYGIELKTKTLELKSFVKCLQTVLTSNAESEKIL